MRLEGEVCGNCNQKIFPPRDICPNCSKHTNEQFIFNGRGEIYSLTTVYDAPTGFEKFAPYSEALIKLDEGPMLTARLTDIDPNINLEIGDKVEVVTRIWSEDGDTGQIRYGYAFRLPISSPKEVSKSSI